MTRVKYEVKEYMSITPCPFGEMTSKTGKNSTIRKAGDCSECIECEYHKGVERTQNESFVICTHPQEGKKNKYEIAKEVVEEYTEEFHTDSFSAWLKKKIKVQKITLLKSMNELITGDIRFEDLLVIDDPNNPESYRALDNNISLKDALGLIKQEKIWYYND